MIKEDSCHSFRSQQTNDKQQGWQHKRLERLLPCKNCLSKCSLSVPYAPGTLNTKDQRNPLTRSRLNCLMGGGSYKPPGHTAAKRDNVQISSAVASSAQNLPRGLNIEQL